MRSRPERAIGRKGTETRSLLLREAEGGDILAMDASLTELYYVKDEGLRIVNFFTSRYCFWTCLLAKSHD